MNAPVRGHQETENTSKMTGAEIQQRHQGHGSSLSTLQASVLASPCSLVPVLLQENCKEH